MDTTQVKIDKNIINKLCENIETQQENMIHFLSELVAIPAISPISGGNGELKKMKKLEELIKDQSFDERRRYDAEDPAAEGGIRPNLMLLKHGKDRSRTLWILCHIDVVPEGDISAWDSDPFKLRNEDGCLYGRGVEDNHQELVSALFALKAMDAAELKPAINIGILAVSDEETGSQYGISHLLEEDIFKPNDLIIVPDSGTPDGAMLEVAERSIAWIKVETKGAQVHASIPQNGVNALRAGSQFLVKGDELLHKRFSRYDELFDPPVSTFEPTKKEKNVDNINTVPGKDVFYFDCRLDPHYNLDEIMDTLREVANEVEQEHKVNIELEFTQREEAAPPTSPDAPVVKLFQRAVDMVYDNKPYPGGIGGGTCAALLRREGYPVLVWSKIEDVCHSSNEYILVENMVNDSKVYGVAYCLLDDMDKI